MGSPASAQSSLSHWITVRRFIDAGSMGTTDDSGRAEITKPPGWIPRCRGSASSPVTRRTSARARGSAGSRPIAWSAFPSDSSSHSAAVAAEAWPSTRLASQSACAAGKPSTRIESRSAERAWYSTWVHTMAACSRPYVS